MRKFVVCIFDLHSQIVYEITRSPTDKLAAEAVKILSIENLKIALVRFAILSF